MHVALRGSYVDFVVFMGITEKYPLWFKKVSHAFIYMDASRFTLYVDKSERRPDYYEKKLIENYSVFIRKPNGDLHVTDYDVFSDLYRSFKYNSFTNSGIAALEEDSIEYVECQPGVLSREYPGWFYEYFTEAMNYPHDNEIVSTNGQASVTSHCVFLRNRFGEIKGMEYVDFLKYYDPDPKAVR